MKQKLEVGKRRSLASHYTLTTGRAFYSRETAADRHELTVYRYHNGPSAGWAVVVTVYWAVPLLALLLHDNPRCTSSHNPKSCTSPLARIARNPRPGKSCLVHSADLYGGRVRVKAVIAYGLSTVTDIGDFE